MAVAKMESFRITGPFDRLEDVIEACLKNGSTHPENTADTLASLPGFVHINDENPYAQNLSKLTGLMRTSGIDPDESLTQTAEYSPEEVAAHISLLEGELAGAQKKRGAASRELESARANIEQLTHFTNLNIELRSVLACRYIKVRFGRIPSDGFLKLKSYNENPYVIFFPCSSDGSYYWGIYAAPLEEISDVDRIFASLFFERMQICESSGKPGEELERLRSVCEEITASMSALDARIGGLIERERGIILKIYAQLKHKHDIFEFRRYSARYHESFVQILWIPQEESAGFAKTLDALEGIEYSVEKPTSGGRSTPPTKLKNSRFFKPFEFYVEMFGLPNYHEVDPTPLVAITYTLFFGMMFADVGQGLVLAIIGFLMYKLKGMKLGRILVPCGICAACFGVVFGSVFGFEHMLDPLYRAVGFHEKPIEVMDSVTSLLLFSVGIGMAMLPLAMIFGIYSALKRRDFEAAFFGANGVAGLFFYLSAVALTAGMLFGIDLPVPAVIPTALAGAAVVLMYLREPLGALLFGKKHTGEGSRGEYYLISFFELFETLLSYVTNTVSFMRISAFVMVHAGMMLAFFTLAEMLGAYGFIAIILGNVLVLALEGLLVGIQALRLQYYEMFSRFFEGDGHAFSPISLK